MKKIVILFIVSAMILTGISGENAKKECNTDKVTEGETKPESETGGTGSASVESSPGRYYSKYAAVPEKIPENNNAGKSAETQNETKDAGTQSAVPEAEPETQPEVCEETAKPEPESESETETQTEIQSEIQPEPESESETETQTEIQLETQPEPEPETLPVSCSAGITISDGDYNELLKIVEAEAGNQDDVGKILVANVIFNRVRNYAFPSTVTEVIYQNSGSVYQFEPVLNGRINTVSVSESTIECVNRALAGEDYSQGALYFTMRTSDESWFNTCLTLLFIHGDHYFYTC